MRKRTRRPVVARHAPEARPWWKATRPAGDTISAETNLLRELHWSPTALGIVMGAGGIGGILGWLFFRVIGKSNLFPTRDPRLAGSIKLTN